MSFRSVFYYINLALLFLFLPFLIPKSTFAVCSTTCGDCITQPTCLSPCVWNTVCSNPTPTTDSTPTPDPTANQIPTLTPWQQFWNWLIDIFIKDYDIPTDTSSQQNNFTNYGDVDDARNENINSSENRITSNNQQFYFKGQYIKDVINNIMVDKVIAKICDQKIISLPNSCDSDFKISCLARYFVEDSQTFLYADQNGTKIDLPFDLIQSIKDKSSDCIILPQPQLAEYQNIYLNFFRVPPEYDDATKNQNATRVLRTPIPDSVQSPIPNNPAEIGQDIENQQKQLNQNFIPEGFNWSGLKSLRPAGW